MNQATASVKDEYCFRVWGGFEWQKHLRKRGDKLTC